MPFLQRSNSSRLRKNNPRGSSGLMDPATTTVAQRDVFDNIDEAVQEHRRSMAGRPKSAGVDKRKRSASKKRTEIATQPLVEAVKEPKCVEDLQKAGQTIEYRTGLDTFNFPTPSPRIPPRSATLQQTSPPFPGMPPRSATFQPSPSRLGYGESPHIGLAIGSPSNAPPSWGRSYTSDYISNRMRQPPPDRAPPPVPGSEDESRMSQSPEQKKKKSSWKTFGSLFRKSSKRDTMEPFYKVKQPAPPQTIGVPYESPELDVPVRPDTPLSCLRAATPSFDRPSHSRSPSCIRAQSRLDDRQDPNRTSFMPTVKSKITNSPRKRGSATPSPLTPGVWKRSNPWRASEEIVEVQNKRHDSPMSDREPNDYLLPMPRTPRLYLDLPEPEFPRYSVMFEKLLSNETKPSLLERRQSKVQRTKSQKRRDGDANRLMVNIDGTGVKRALTSPHLSRTLSIRVDGKKIADEPETAIHRPRPIRRSKTAPSGAISPIAAAFMRQKEAQNIESSPESPGSELFSEASLPGTPTTITTCTDTSSIRRVIEQNEPAWDMITSKPSFEVSDDFTHRSEAYPRVKSPQDLERQIVQVSVARQVSVSRARSRVQRAASSKTAAQPLRPRVVELTKNRKSTVGVMEDASADEAMPEGAASIAHSRAASEASMMSRRSKKEAGDEEPMPENAVASVAHSRAASHATQNSVATKIVVGDEPMPETMAEEKKMEADATAEVVASES